MESPAIKLKYKVVGGFEFAQLMQIITNTKTENKNASHINQVVKRVEAARKEIHEEYMKEIRAVYAKRDESGNVDLSGAQPGDENYFTPIEDKIEEFKKAQDAFGEKEVVIDWRPLTPATLVDVRLSAKDIGLLGDLYSEQEGPGLPQFQNVKNIRK